MGTTPSITNERHCDPGVMLISDARSDARSDAHSNEHHSRTEHIKRILEHIENMSKK